MRELGPDYRLDVSSVDFPRVPGVWELIFI